MTQRPDRPKRRTFTKAYKARILAAFDALPEGSPERGALLRSERLYHSHIEHWRKQAEKGTLAGTTGRLGRTHHAPPPVFGGLSDFRKYTALSARWAGKSPDMPITTGTDVAEETRAFNDQLAELLASFPALHEVNDAAATRAARERGEGPFPAPVRISEAEERRVPGRAGDIPLRVLRPPTIRGVYLHIHGGGWTLGTHDGQDPLLWRLARAAEVAVVSVGYRLAPEHPYPAGPDDCEDAARWLVANAAASFGSDRLAIGGESAGAHLSVVTLLRLGDLAGAFRAAQLSFGAFDLSMTPSQRLWGDRQLVLSTPIIRWFVEQFLPGMAEEQRRHPDISPLYADLSGMPPARFMVGTADPLLDDTLFMAERWRAAESPAEVEVIAEAAHGFLPFPIEVAERELTAQERYIGNAMT